MSRLRGTVAASLIVVAATAAGSGANFLFQWLAARRLSAADFSLLAAMLAVIAIALLPGPSSDPTPDLLATSPNGSHVYMSLRGPNPLTADPHVSTGSTPGVGVVKALESGRSGVFESVARVSNVDAGGVERADVHAMTIRVP